MATFAALVFMLGIVAVTERRRVPDLEFALRNQTIGILMLHSFSAQIVDGLRDGLHAFGVEGIDIRIKNAAGDDGKLVQLASELVKERPDYLVAVGGAATEALLAARSDTPTLFIDVELPEERGFALSGVKNTYAERTGERMALMREIAPRYTTFTLITSDRNLAGVVAREKAEEFAAAHPEVTVRIVEANSSEELTNWLATKLAKTEVIFLAPVAYIQDRSTELIRQLRSRRVPVIGLNLQMTRDGALFSFGEMRYDMGVRAASLLYDMITDRRGENIVVLGVEPVLTINRTTARMLNIALPAAVLERAAYLVE